MRPRVTGFVGKKEADYIHLLLGHPEPRGKEAALERLCAHYRAGRRLKDAHGICNTLTGLIFDPDVNVRRWAFNAIALVGNKAQNFDATVDAMARNRANEDVFAAGIAALFALTKEEEAEFEIKRLGEELEGSVLLAAAQHAPSFQSRLAKRGVDPDTASASELRLATVLVGVEKAPENLFSTKFSNAEMIGSFHSHEDRQVGQYATWAAFEHPNMGLQNLGFAPDKLRDQTPEVRKYGARLITTDDATAERYWELVQELGHDDDTKVREGLAIGLAQAYFDGLEDITIEWFGREPSLLAREAILDHFVAHAHRCGLYADIAKQQYRDAAVGSIIRAKLEARAEGTPLYAELKRIDFSSPSHDLFGFNPPYIGQPVTKNITINAHTVGVVADTSNIGGDLTQNTYIEQAENHLHALAGLLNDAVTAPEAAEGKELIDIAQAEPTKDNVSKVLGWMKAVKAGTGLLVASAGDFSKIMDGLQSAIDHLS